MKIIDISGTISELIERKLRKKIFGNKTEQMEQNGINGTKWNN